MELILVIAFLGGVTFLVKFYFDDKEVLKRKLHRFPLSGYNTCKTDDTVRLIGIVEIHSPPILAPLSKRECVYYQLIIEEKNGRSRSAWESIVHHERAANFFISNGKEKALISTRNVKPYLRHEVTYYSRTMGEYVAILKDYLERYVYPSRYFKTFEHAQYRCHERILEIGDHATVAGKVIWKQASQVGLPEGHGKVLYLKTIDDKTPLLLSNDPDLILMNRTIIRDLKNRLWKR